MVYQNYAFSPHMPVCHNMAFGPKLIEVFKLIFYSEATFQPRCIRDGIKKPPQPGGLVAA